MKTHLLALILGAAVQCAHAEITALAHPGEKLPADQTVVWSAVFQGAWDELNRTAGRPVRVESPNELMTALDSFQWKPEEVMPEGAWKTWCGPATQDFLKQVNSEAAAITREPNAIFSLNSAPNGSLAFFGILDREVEFSRAFFRSTKIAMNFHTGQTQHPVRFFGVRGEPSDDFGADVRVLAWRPLDGSHAIQIRCKQADDSVILYLPPVNQDFVTACGWLRSWRSQFKPEATSFHAWNDNSLHRNDEIQIPYISLESKVDFAPLLGGARYCDKSPEPLVISRAEQITHFQLYEKGARVRVEVSGETHPISEPPATIPRQFLYDRPFFVFLWRDRAEWPYFGAWIGDESALEPFQQSP
jgi:hypothetical protein